MTVCHETLIQQSLAVLSSMWIHFNISSLLIWSCCYTQVTGEPVVIGASQTVLAKAGDDVVLPCHVQPPFTAAQTSTLEMSVEWTREDQEEEPCYVNALRDGRVVTRSINPSYRRRTSLFRDQLPRGNVSLRLSGVRLSDEGTFRCSVPGLPGGGNRNSSSSALIRLLVGSVSQPVISLNGATEGGAVLSLTCDSGCWYPRPEVTWLVDDGGDPPLLLLLTTPRPPEVTWLVDDGGDPLFLLTTPRPPEVTWLVDAPVDEGDPPLLLLNAASATERPSAYCYTVRTTVTVPATERPSAYCYTVRTTVTVPALSGRPADLTCRVHLPHINHTAETHRRLLLLPDVVDASELTDGAAVHAVLIPVITGVVILSAAILMSCWKNRRATGCWRNRPSCVSCWKNRPAVSCWRSRSSESCWRNRSSVAAEANRLLHI